MTRASLVEAVLDVIWLVAVFILSAALVGVWLGLALRFVWVLQ